MRDPDDDGWIIALLDDDAIVDERQVSFEGSLRTDLRREWKRSQPRAGVSMRRRAILLAAFAAAAAAIVVAVVRLDSDVTRTVDSPGTETIPGDTEPSPTTSLPSDTSIPPVTTAPTRTGAEVAIDRVDVVLAAQPALVSRDVRPFDDLDDPDVLVSAGGQVLLIERNGEERVLSLGLGGNLVDTSVRMDGARDAVFGLDGRLYVLRAGDGSASITNYEPQPDGRWIEIQTGTFGGGDEACTDLSVVAASDDPDTSWSVGCDSGSVGIGIPPGLASVAVTDDGTITVTLQGVSHSWIPATTDDVGTVDRAWAGPNGTAVVTFAAPGDGSTRIAVLDEPGRATAVPLPAGIDPLGISGTSLIAIDEARSVVVAVDLAELIAGRTLDPDRYVPECAPSNSGSTGPSPQRGRLDTFGPIGIEPNLVVSLPSTVSGAAPAPQPPVANATRISGGVLISVRPISGPNAATMLAAVNHDGTVRWVRCDALTMVPFAAPDATEALLAEIPSDGRPIEMSVISLTDGATQSDFADEIRAIGIDDDARARMQVLASSPMSVVFGTSSNAGGDPTVDVIAIVSLDDMAVRRAPLPPAENDVQTSLRFAADGTTLTLVDERGETIALVDGAWAAVEPTRPVVGYEFGQSPQSLTATMGGVEQWRRSDLVAPIDEGFHAAPTGRGATLVRACETEGGDVVTTPCTHVALLAVDDETGATVWRLDGDFRVSVIGDGFALVSPPAGGWTMIDVRTGDEVPGQSWPDGTSLGSECCGGHDTVHTTLIGGLVVAVNGTEMWIYYPLESARPTVRVTIP